MILDLKIPKSEKAFISPPPEEVERGALKLVHKFEKSEDRFQIVLIRENEDKEGISKFVEFLENYKINRDNAPLVTKVKKTKK